MKSFPKTASENKSDTSNTVTAFEISTQLRKGVSLDIWADASAENDTFKEIWIHNAQSSMLKGANFIDEATSSLTAIIEELDGVSGDPESHVNVALRRAQELMSKYSQIPAQESA